MRTEVTTYYLEMLEPAWLHASSSQPDDIELKQATIPCPELNRFLYTAVGGDWFWTDRLPWTYDQWLTYLSRPELETWVALFSGTPAGYVELESRPHAQVEIVYFGLLPQFIGHGIGGYLLTFAIERAWQMHASRISVDTCTLDHPNALRNYQLRGFRIYKQEVSYADLPETAPGPWPGAQRSLHRGA